MIENSPCPVGLLKLDENEIRVVRISSNLQNLGFPFSILDNGMLLKEAFNDEDYKQIENLIKFGLFKGKRRVFKGKWKTTYEGKERNWYSITVPIMTEKGEWYAHNTTFPEEFHYLL